MISLVSLHCLHYNMGTTTCYYVKREEQNCKVGGNYEFFFILKENSVSQNKKSGLILSFRQVMHCSFPQIEVVYSISTKRNMLC